MTPRPSDRRPRGAARRALLLACVAALLALPGCVTTHRSGSLVDYLFPQGGPQEVPEAKGALPERALCAGVAFVPGAESRVVNTGGGAPIGEAEDIGQVLKQDVVERIASELEATGLFAKVHELPASYLRPGGGPEDLQRLRAAFDIDVLVLLSYDQLQDAETTFWSITYLFLLPIWFVPGETMRTESYVDAAVLDLHGPSLLARAGGTSVDERSYVPVYYGRAARNSSGASFRGAVDELLTALVPALRDALPGADARP